MAAASVGLVAAREEPYNSTHNKVQKELNRQGAKNAKEDIHSRNSWRPLRLGGY
jgi:hypothetical protein